MYQCVPVCTRECAPGVYIGYTIELLNFSWLILYVIDIAEHNRKVNITCPSSIYKYCLDTFMLLDQDTGEPGMLQCVVDLQPAV